MRGSSSKNHCLSLDGHSWDVSAGLNQQSFGQDVNASLSGSVTDPSGAAIPGAKLTLTNENSGAQQNFQTDAGGRIQLPQSHPGNL